MLKVKKFYIFFILSFFVVAFSEKNFLGILASFMGYALFWKSMLFLKKGKNRFWLSTFWFFSVQGVWLFWMTSTEYVGNLILVVYFSLIFLWGVQFGFLSLMIKKQGLKTFKIFLIAATWTIFEWMRLFLLCGFTWNPVGLALANNHFSMQLASIVGVYGLSFYVILSNLFFLKIFVLKRVSLFLVVIISFPYFFGFVHEKVQEKFFKSNEKLSVVLVQPGVTPSEKAPMFLRGEDFIFPLEQWRRILCFLKEKQKKKIDLIVLPEAAVPFGAFKFFYDYDVFLDIWGDIFGEGSFKCLPILKEPFARKNEISNAYFAQAIANYFNSEVIIGLEDSDKGLKKKDYNAAFHFLPNENSAKRYEKQILMPIVEYFPFSWCIHIAKRYGLGEIFIPGKGNKVFYGKVPFSISICYEETFGNLMRLRRKKGAKLFINVTNDAWFPKSKLPEKHFDLGKIRSVENGVPIIRACNTGVTGGVDCFGRVLKKLEMKNILTERVAGALHVDLPLNNYLTLYTFWGDKFIIVISFLILFLGVFCNKYKIKDFL